jgi:nucleotide-binding universal stress UspA family protein
MSIRSILVGVADLENDPVLPAAVELAQRVGATLHAVHTFEIHHLVLRAHYVLGTLERDARALYEAALRERVEAQVRRISETVDVRARAVAEPGGDALVAVAAEVGAELIVVGATRQGPVMRHILGSTADRVIRTSSVPVLVAKPPFEMAFRRLLLTTDRSALSAEALARGVGVAMSLTAVERPEARCIEVTWADEWVRTPISPEQLQREEHQELSRFLEPLNLPVGPVESRVRLGDPAKEIVAEAAEWGADLIVTGSRGHAGVSRFLLGSVAASVLRSAFCNVLVVPAGGASESGASSRRPR